MQIPWLGLVTLLSTGCYSSWEAKDIDGDGVAGTTDCWESNEDPVPPVGAMQYDTPLRATDIYVGAEDRPYDGIDANCDGLDDFDVDGDGFVPNVYVGIATLGLVETGSLPGGDCDDADSVRHPDTEELCDGVINGCDAQLPDLETDFDGDGFVECSIVETGWEGDSTVIGGDDCDDENEILFPTQEWYADIDTDGFGDAGNTLISCTQPEGYLLDSTDCDDNDATVSPEALELCDGQPNVCGSELAVEEIDDDGDGYVDCSIDVGGWDGEPNVVGGDDCSDIDGSVFISQTYYLDADQDGFGDPNAGLSACEQPTGYVLDANDCNDLDATVYLNAPEICDGLANTCVDTLPGDEIDNDADGFVECIIDGDGWDGDSNVIDGGDCNDANNLEFPGQIWYEDGDSDAIGSSVSTTSCAQPTGFVLSTGDCNDADATVYPNATELCDGQLNACGDQMLAGEVDADGDGYVVCILDAGGWDGVGSVIDGDDCVDTDALTFPGSAELDSTTSCMRDADGDGYGDSSVTGATSAGTDCDDADSVLNPDTVWYEDSDGDGYGNANSTQVQCLQPTGYLLDNTDCVDTDADQRPGQDWYQDSDGDGEGGAIAMTNCTQPAGFVVSTGDCNDNNDTIYTTAPELCDGLPNVCGTALASDEIDDDGDGFVECAITTGWSGDASVIGGDDCNDGNSFLYPGAASAESATECMLDADLDGYGDVRGLAEGATLNGSDTNDNDDTVYPNAPELCDGQVNNSLDTYLPGELDDDLDGYVECEIDSGGWDGSASVLGGGDCDPNNASFHPYADEYADLIDHNCDKFESGRGFYTCVGATMTVDVTTGAQKYFLFCDLPRSANTSGFLCRNTQFYVRYDELASIHSQEEMDFAANLASTSFFIGYKRASSSQSWFWRDGSTVTYEYNTFVESTDANNVIVQFSGASSNSSQWTAVDDNHETGFMCSKEL